MITIGERKLETRRPADLDAALIAVTGCSASEHAAMLSGGGGPAQIAKALHPMLSEEISLPALGQLIAEADQGDVRKQVVELLGGAPLDLVEPIAEEHDGDA